MPAPDVLLALLRARGPSGHESEVAAVWREAAAGFAEVSSDALGTCYARVRGGDGPLVAVYGHIDEVGLAVTHVDDDGFLRVRGIGGWNPMVPLGQRAEIITRDGIVPGVVGARRDPTRAEEKRRVELTDLYLDIGAASADEARSLVRPGDAAVLVGEPSELRNGRIVSRALDNRLGSYVALEAVRRIAEDGGAAGDVVGVVTVQEEPHTGPAHAGAQTSAFALEPDVALVIDVTPATDVPGGDPAEGGEARIGGGVAILRGPSAHRRVSQLLCEAADEEQIPFTIEVATGRSQTDADAIYVTRAGVPTGLLSIPMRHLHTPVELAALDDVEACVRLVVAFAQRVDASALSA